MKTMPILLIDVSGLCHWSLYKVPEKTTSLDDVRIGVVLNFMHRLLSIAKRFKTNRLVFVFDGRRAVEHRRKIFKDYKRGRQENRRMAPELEKMRQAGRHEAECQLRKEVLPLMGFCNLVRDNNFEGDDMAAQFIKCYPFETIIMITGDNDMLQCLTRDVSMYSPSKREVVTIENFINKYGLNPRQWADVKAWGGCGTDGVPGIGRVATTTAVKYLRKCLTDTVKAKFATDHAKEIYERNLKLVKLPMEGTPKVELVEDEFTQEGFGEACDLALLYSFKQEPKLGEWRNFFKGDFDQPNMVRHAEYNFNELNRKRKANASQKKNRS